MKIRSGFVSNSSSSSFICTGWVVPIEKYTPHQLKMMAVLFSNAFFPHDVDNTLTTLPIFLDDIEKHFNWRWKPIVGYVSIEIQDGHDDLPINGSLEDLCEHYPNTEEGWEELSCDIMTLAASRNIAEFVEEKVDVFCRALNGDSPYIKLLPNEKQLAIGLMSGQGDGSPRHLMNEKDEDDSALRPPKMTKEVEQKFRRIFDIPDDMPVECFSAGYGNTM